MSEPLLGESLDPFLDQRRLPADTSEVLYGRTDLRSSRCVKERAVHALLHRIEIPARTQRDGRDSMSSRLERGQAEVLVARGDESRGVGICPIASARP